jgi:hypothetical protein
MEGSKMKPDCHKCKWKENISGDAHVCCKHPSLEKTNNNLQLQLLSLLQSAGRASSIPINNSKLNIKGNQHGIAKGWFNFPFNFDPVWLENCDGFEIKEETK